MSIDVGGYCPMGCGPTLVLAGQEWAGEGNVTCSAEGCPDPGAVNTILQDPETEHVVELREKDFTLRHPLRERVDGDLFDCEIHRRLRELGKPPREPGRYRVTIHQPDAVSESYRSGEVGLDFEPIGGAT